LSILFCYLARIAAVIKQASAAIEVNGAAIEVNGAAKLGISCVYIFTFLKSSSHHNFYEVLL